MDNSLTGKYQAVLAFQVEAVNRILATLHQNGDDKEASPTFLHSFALRIGEVPVTQLQLDPEGKLSRFTNVTGILDSLVRGSKIEQVLAVHPKAPPGISKAADDLKQELLELLERRTTPAAVVGTAWVQLSPPRVSFPPGSTSEVTVHIEVRAHYEPDPNTQSLPGPIHGEVQATYSLEQMIPKYHFDQKFLVVNLTADDNKIKFLPAQGTITPGEAETIADHIRSILRHRFEPTNVQLDQGFDFNGFKSFGSGDVQAITLPVTVSGASPGMSGLDDIPDPFDNLLTSGHHFAVAISKQLLQGQIQPAIDSLNGYHQGFSITVTLWVILAPVDFTVNYTVSITTVEVTWEAGSIKVIVNGNVTTSSIFPNYTFIITATLTAALDIANQRVSLEISGLDVQVSGAFKGRVQSYIETNAWNAFTAFLNSANDQIGGTLAGAVRLDDALKSFDDSATSKYTSVEIHPDGVILRGSVSTKERSDAVAQYHERGHDRMLTAYRSWIPAGNIERFEWSWTVSKSAFEKFPWQRKVESFTSEHSFIFRPTQFQVKDELTIARPMHLGHVCLKVIGKQTAGHLGGPEQEVEDGESCTVDSQDFVFEMPGWWVRIMELAVWPGDPQPEELLEDSIVAHVNPVEHSRLSRTAAPKTLVHFSDAKVDRPLETLSRALIESRHRDTPALLVLVLPRGFLRDRQSAVERRLGSLSEELSVSLSVTEDYEGGWASTFGVERTPATYMVNGSGEVVWQQMGALNAPSLTEAVNEHFTPGVQLRSRPLRLAIHPGDLAPDFLFDSGRGERIALRKLRGQRVLITFWKSWSTPCLAELRRLQRLNEHSDRRGPVILAVNDGENPQNIDGFRREHNLTYTLVSDPYRRIAQRYGVNCWPATIAVGVKGLVDRIHLGVTRDRPHGHAKAHGSS